MKGNQKVREKGITLIAVVITVIVLLILAGVTLNEFFSDSGILTQVENAKKQTKEVQALEEVTIAIQNLTIKETENTLLIKEEKSEILEKEIKEMESSSKVLTTGEGFIVKHKDYIYAVSDDYDILEIFDINEWDKTAAKHDAFIWESNDPNNEGYGTVVGYTANVGNYPTLRFPSRCTKILTKESYIVATDEYTTNQIRNFTQNVKEIELPSTITEIGDMAFGKIGNQGYVFASLEKINIPRSVNSINWRAFYNCRSLKSITIPDSVTSMGSEIFIGCSGLTSVTISKNTAGTGSSTFSGCTSLTNVIIQEGVTSIAGGVFSYCTSLTSIIIPNTVTSIGDNAFGNCTNLENVNIPSSVTTIGINAFENVPHIVYNGDATGEPWGALSMN